MPPPVLPPPASCHRRKCVCEWNKCVSQSYLRAPSTTLFKVLSTEPWNFSLWEGAFYSRERKVRAVWGHPHSALLQSISTRSAGLRSPIREWWLNPWDEKRRGPPEIQSRVSRQDTKSCALANSITLGFYQVLCGEMEPSHVKVRTSEREREMDALELLLKGVSTGETRSGWVFLFRDIQIGLHVIPGVKSHQSLSLGWLTGGSCIWKLSTCHFSPSLSLPLLRPIS